MLFPAGVVEPDDLKMLVRVFDAVCEDATVDLDSKGRQAVASHIFRLFMNGLTTEAELFATMRHRERHRHISATDRGAA